MRVFLWIGSGRYASTQALLLEDKELLVQNWATSFPNDIFMLVEVTPV